jgi:hypothetical protein
MEFVRRIVKEYEWIMEAKIEQISILLQERIIPIGEYIAEELYMSSINHPIKVCWPKGKHDHNPELFLAMKYFRREDFMKDLYPTVSRLKKFGICSHRELFKKATEKADKINIMNTRLDIM